MGENSHWTKATSRELDTRVPLIFRIPGQKPFVTTAITEYIDIYPTLAELSHLPLPANIDGRSFNQVFNDASYQHKESALSQTARPWPSSKPIKQMGYSIRTDSYRYTRWVTTKQSKLVSEELYHSEKDPLERNNLIKSANVQLLNKLRNLLNQKLKRQP